MINPRNIQTIEPGFVYNLPVFAVTPEGIVHDEMLHRINFCRGDKTNESVPRQPGVFIESLLETCVQRLSTVNTGDLATRETSIAITKIQEALMWLEKRSADRQLRNVEGTYQK